MTIENESMFPVNPDGLEKVMREIVGGKQPEKRESWDKDKEKQIISGKFESIYLEKPFDEGKKELESRGYRVISLEENARLKELEIRGYRVISLEENARLRMQEGKDSFISRNGNWVREGVIYVPKKGIFLTKNSPIMDNAKKATDCHRNRKDFYLTNSQVEKALEDSVELKKEKIPTNRFKDNKIAVYAFGDIAEQYGNFLKEAEINEMPVWLEDMQNKSFARQLWFWDLGARSELNGNLGDLYDNNRVRGVLNSRSAK
ncbi:MAG: hypothetical protein V1660_02600 [archaeon]